MLCETDTCACRQTLGTQPKNIQPAEGRIGADIRKCLESGASMGLRHRPTGELVGVSACLFESRADTLTPTQPANELVRRKSLYYHYRYYFFSNYHFHFMYSFMCLSIGLFIYLYICIHLFIYLLSITVFIHVSLIYAFIFSIYLSIYPPIYLSTYLLLNPFNDRFIITL